MPCVVSRIGPIFVRNSSAISSPFLLALAAPTAITITAIACTTIATATRPTKINSNRELPDESEPASCSHIPDITIRRPSISSLALLKSMSTIIKPGHQKRLTGPCLTQLISTNSVRSSCWRTLPCPHRSRQRPCPGAPGSVPCPSPHTGPTVSVRGHSTPCHGPHIRPPAVYPARPGLKLCPGPAVQAPPPGLWRPERSLPGPHVSLYRPSAHTARQPARRHPDPQETIPIR